MISISVDTGLSPFKSTGETPSGDDRSFADLFAKRTYWADQFPSQRIALGIRLTEQIRVNYDELIAHLWESSIYQHAKDCYKDDSADGAVKAVNGQYVKTTLLPKAHLKFFAIAKRNDVRDDFGSLEKALGVPIARRCTG